MRIQNFIIAFAIVGLFASIIGLYLASTPVIDNVYTYNSSMLDGYNKITELQANMEDMNQTLTSVQQGDNPDVGSWIGSGFTVIKTTFTSFSMFSDITNEAVEQSGLGTGGNSFKVAIMIVVFTLFIFAVISLLVGRDA